MDFEFDTTQKDLEELSIEELHNYGLEAGIDWSQVGHQRAISKREEIARELATDKPPLGAAVIQAFMMWLGHTVLLSVMLLIQRVMIPVSVLGLSYVEYLRVRQGVRIFDPDNAGMASAVIVVFALGLLFARSESATNDDRLRNAYIVTVAAIVALGFFGVLREEINDAANNGVTVDAALSVLLGTAVTVAFYVGLEFIVGYNYENYTKLLKTFDFLSGTQSDTAAENARREYMIYQIRKQRLKQQ